LHLLYYYDEMQELVDGGDDDDVYSSSDCYLSRVCSASMSLEELNEMLNDPSCKKKVLKFK